MTGFRHASGDPGPSSNEGWPWPYPVREHARGRPNQPALVDVGLGRSVTYGELDELVEGMAATVRPHVEDTLGILVDGGLAYATAFFAALRLDAAAVPLPVDATVPELAEHFDRLPVDAVVVRSSHRSVLTASLEDRCSESVEFVDLTIEDLGLGDRDSGDRGHGSLALVVPGGRSEPGAREDPTADSRAIDPCCYLATSGTTGTPNVVTLTATNLLASALGSAMRLGTGPTVRWLSPLPPWHMGGLAPMVRATVHGGTVVYQRPFDPDETIRTAREERVTGLSLVPVMLEGLLEAAWKPPDSLRFVLLGGAAAGPSLIERARAAGIPVRPTYGATETSSQVATATEADLAAEPSAVGRPLALTSVTIVDENDTPVEAGATGEIVVDGPTVTPGYLDRDAWAARRSSHGFHTGDEGYLDGAGRLHVTGRIDARIVTGGEVVDPASVEATLREHPSVADAGVAGVPDEEWGEIVGAVIVPGAFEGSVAAIEAFVTDRLASHRRPRLILASTSVPRTASGTVDRPAVRDQLRAAFDDVPAPDPD